MDYVLATMAQIMVKWLFLSVCLGLFIYNSYKILEFFINIHKNKFTMAEMIEVICDIGMSMLLICVFIVLICISGV